MGLYLGVSVLSLFEYIELLLDVAVVAICKILFRSKPSNEATDESSSDENESGQPQRSSRENPPEGRPSYYRPQMRRRHLREHKAKSKAKSSDENIPRGVQNEETNVRPVYVNTPKDDTPAHLKLRRPVKRRPHFRSNRVESSNSSGEDGTCSPNTRNNAFKRPEILNSFQPHGPKRHNRSRPIKAW